MRAEPLQRDLRLCPCPLPPQDSTARRWPLGTLMPAPISHRICQPAGLGLPGLQNCERSISSDCEPRRGSVDFVSSLNGLAHCAALSKRRQHNIQAQLWGSFHGTRENLVPPGVNRYKSLRHTKCSYILGRFLIKVVYPQGCRSTLICPQRRIPQTAMRTLSSWRIRPADNRAEPCWWCSDMYLNISTQSTHTEMGH